jgi:hypothetical protein
MIGAAKINFISKFTSTAVAEVIRKKQAIAAVGNAQIDTAQSKFGGSSLLGDGTGDYLQLATDSQLSLSGDFTIECWYRIPSTVPAILPFYNSDHLFYLTNDAGTAKYALFQGGSNRLLTSGVTVSSATWYHVAFVRSGSTITAYHNGVSAGSATWASTISGTTPTIGSYSSYYINGHYDEFRISKTARYTGNFTPATTPFVNDNDTVLLIHANGTDASTVFDDDNGVRSQKGIQAIGNAKVSTTQSKFGGTSLALDGTGDYLIVNNADSNLSFSTSADFTFEAWCYFANTTTAFTILGGPGQTSSFSFSRESDNTVRVGRTNTAWDATSTGSATTANTWTHVAASRASGTLKIFVNGTSIYSGSNSFAYPCVNMLGVGGETYYGSTANGYVDEVRVSNTARYTGNFTPSTTPFVNDANTLLLIHANGTDATTSFHDDNGGASSINLTAASTHYLTVPYSSDFNFGTGDFTIEWWQMGVGSQTGYPRLFAVGVHPMPLGVSYESGNIYFWINASSTMSTTFTITANVWDHVAITRSSGTIKMFRNGTQIATTTNSSGFTSSASLDIGWAGASNTCFNGRIAGFHFVKGTAKYTGNFTPSPTIYGPIANSKLLINTDGQTTIVDSSGTGKTITAMNGASIVPGNFYS